jgi:RND superfamily putative drug exporter
VVILTFVFGTVVAMVLPIINAIIGLACVLAMVFVFGSFVLNGDPTVKQFGIGLAVAVILDATAVGCLLVPAVMVLMGSTGTCHGGSTRSSRGSASRERSSSNRASGHAPRPAPAPAGAGVTGGEQR